MKYQSVSPDIKGVGIMGHEYAVDALGQIEVSSEFQESLAAAGFVPATDDAQAKPARKGGKE